VSQFDPYKMENVSSAADFLKLLSARVRQSPPKRIVFPEGSDERVRSATARLEREGIVQPLFPSGSDKYWQMYHESRRAKGVTESEARMIASRPLYHAALMVAAGDADGFVGGASNTTAETVRAVLHCIGPAPGIATISSFFIVAVRDRTFGSNGLLLFADCAIVVEPTAGQLAEIAIATAGNTRAILGVEPRVAMLSFSTRRSAVHPCIDRIGGALEVVRQRDPLLIIDGEMQADAALVPGVSRSKAPGSELDGSANTLIFPDLTSGNIAVKLVERLGGAMAIGPVLQGAAKPANDLSRGCSADDIYAVALITALQAADGAPA
jgi:phosphate acetyltransferase